MSDTPPIICSTTATSACGSWVDLTKEFSGLYSGPATPPAGPAMCSESDYCRMLSEAQRELSARSSARVSPISSALISLSSTRRNTPSQSRGSPKSPPNSPNVELVVGEELKNVYINQIDTSSAVADFMWDWSSRPNNQPPKDWRRNNSSRGSSTIVSIKKERKTGLTRDVVYTLVFTNILSLIVGAGIGIWIFRRSSTDRLTALSID